MHWIDTETGRRVGPLREIGCWILYWISYVAMFGLVTITCGALVWAVGSVLIRCLG